MRCLWRSLLIIGILPFLPMPAFATADGPDAWEISGDVPATLYTEPNLSAQIMRTIPPGTRGLRNQGCEGRPPFDKWVKLSPQEMAAVREKIWCRTTFAGSTGWLRSVHLGEPTGQVPTFDCGRADGTVEELICRDDNLASLDHAVSKAYWGALGAAINLDTGASQARATVRTMQRGWIKGRNDCWKTEDIPACVSDNYETRIAELQVTWMLVPSKTPLNYSCDGNAELVVVQFETAPRAAVAVEFGDSRQAYMQVRSASGVKYSGPFGQTLWLKGPDAIFKPDQEKPDLSCRLKAR